MIKLDLYGRTYSLCSHKVNEKNQACGVLKYFETLKFKIILNTIIKKFTYNFDVGICLKIFE